MKPNDQDRFFSKIQKTDSCWFWTGSISNNGYGKLSIGRQMVGAHRYSYEHHFGKIPKNLSVCHACDVRNCVRPDHLFLGSARDNMIDCILKGRKNRKLSVDQIRAIRADETSSHYRLGKKFGVDPSLISRIRKGSAWKILPAASSGPTSPIIPCGVYQS